MKVFVYSRSNFRVYITEKKISLMSLMVVRK